MTISRSASRTSTVDGRTRDSSRFARQVCLRAGGALLVSIGLVAAPGLPRHVLAAEQAKVAVRILAVRPEKTEVDAGEALHVSFDLDIPPRWHIYPAATKPLLGSPTVFEFRGAEVAGAIREPRPKYRRYGALESDHHEGRVTITVPVRLRPGTSPGLLELTGRILYQVCDWDLCLNGETPFRFTLRVIDGVRTPAAAAR